MYTAYYYVISPISVLLILILCFFRHIILQPLLRNLVFIATGSCCSSSFQTLRCRSLSRRSPPLSSTLSPRPCWPLQDHRPRTNTDPLHWQQLVVESTIERLHQGIKAQDPNTNSQNNHIVVFLCVLATYIGDCRYFARLKQVDDSIS